MTTNTGRTFEAYAARMRDWWAGMPAASRAAIRAIQGQDVATPDGAAAALAAFDAEAAAEREREAAR